MPIDFNMRVIFEKLASFPEFEHKKYARSSTISLLRFGPGRSTCVVCGVQDDKTVSDRNVAIDFRADNLGRSPTKGDDCSFLQIGNRLCGINDDTGITTLLECVGHATIIDSFYFDYVIDSGVIRECPYGCDQGIGLAGGAAGCIKNPPDRIQERHSPSIHLCHEYFLQ